MLHLLHRIKAGIGASGTSESQEGSFALLDLASARSSISGSAAAAGAPQHQPTLVRTVRQVLESPTLPAASGLPFFR